MRILLSPSKTQNMKHEFEIPLTTPYFLSKSLELVERINQLNEHELTKVLHAPKTQQKEVLEMYRTFGTRCGSAIESYTGEAFKYLRRGIEHEDLLSLQNHMYIFSALYGLVRPLDKIHPYRLDMTMSLFDNQSLVQFWKEDINQQLSKDDEILSLASKEFEKVITVPYYRVEFLKVDGKRVHTVLAKQMRGMLAQYIVKNKCFSLEEVKAIKLNGFYCKVFNNRTFEFYLEE